MNLPISDPQMEIVVIYKNLVPRITHQFSDHNILGLHLQRVYTISQESELAEIRTDTLQADVQANLKAGNILPQFSRQAQVTPTKQGSLKESI